MGMRTLTCQEVPIQRIEERTERQHVSGSGDAAVFKEVSLGWWAITFPPNVFAIRLGDERPEIAATSRVRLTIYIEEITADGS